MQKKLIALAVAALASSASFAQSNVTIYGVADAAVDFATSSGGSQNAAGTAVNLANRSRVSSNSSYLGFKGTEDLGNGLRAEFQIENEIDLSGNSGINSGNARSNGFATRDTFVGLSSGQFGTVRLGYLSTPHRLVATSFDLMPGDANNGSSLNLIGRANIGALLNPRGANGVAGATEQTFGTTTGAATNNIGANGGVLNNTASVIDRNQALAYVSPTINGFTGMLAYTTNETRDNAAPGAGLSQRNPHAWNIAATYENGPLRVGYSYLDLTDAGVLNGTTASGLTNTGLAAMKLNGSEHTHAHLLGASYNFGQGTTVSGMYDRIEGTLDGSGADDIKLSRNAYTLGVKHVIGANNFTVAYTRVGDTNYNAGTRNLGGDTGDNGAHQYTLRYGYDFSKRTQAYAQYVRLSNGANASYDLSNGTPLSGAGTGGVAAGTDLSVVSVGMRHAF